jgi:hypothetical protein
MKSLLFLRVNITASGSKEASHESFMSKYGQLEEAKGTLWVPNAQAYVE